MSRWFEIRGLEKRFDGITALADFSNTVHEGEILGLLGPNGAGKTTLFNVISGFIPTDSGKTTFRGVDITRFSPHRIANTGIARTFQNLRLIRQLSVLDNVLLSFRQQPGERLDNVFFRNAMIRKVETENTQVAISLLEETGLGHKVNDLAGNLSYGQQKLLSLVCSLAGKADLLLLDEPVAGVAPAMIEKILGIISELPGQGKSIVLIEHNLDVVMQVCDRVVFMDAGMIVSEGTPEEVRNDPKVIESYIN